MKHRGPNPHQAGGEQDQEEVVPPIMEIRPTKVKTILVASE